MNAAMLLQHAAEVIEHRERVYDMAQRSRYSSTRDPSHLDSITDVAGYGALLREVTHRRTSTSGDTA
jgi:hypothetical protein